jgi:isopentenyl-diphosphate delta-isomerase
MSDIEKRKTDHLDIVLSGAARHDADAGFDAIRFRHNALPEIDLASIDLSCTFLGSRLSLPFLASSMTGGPARAAGINLAIAEAAERMGFAMGVGSQRIALTSGSDSGLTREIRARAPTIPIYANLGAVQLVSGMDIRDARRAIEAIGANALILHLNPLQEALQEGGDVNWSGVAEAIRNLAHDLGAPIIAKEVGAGLSADVARRLVDCGVAAIDVAGTGGTSWAAVEGHRASGAGAKALGDVFRNWGIPTSVCLREVRKALPDVPLIASGGIRHGLDIARAVRLGADLAGQAGALLEAAVTGPEAVVNHVQSLADALRIACFATGSKSLADLRRSPLL